MRTFNRDALFLWMTVINGISFSGWQVFFKIYMLLSGFTRDCLGIVNSLPALTGLLLGIPLVAQETARQKALLIGI
jgi:hypothetical protein